MPLRFPFLTRIIVVPPSGTNANKRPRESFGMTNSGELIPPPDRAATVPAGTTVAERIAAWFDLVDATDEIYLATLRSRGLSEAEVMAAYRENYARWVEEHDQRAFAMLAVLNPRKIDHGG